VGDSFDMHVWKIYCLAFIVCGKFVCFFYDNFFLLEQFSRQFSFGASLKKPRKIRPYNPIKKFENNKENLFIAPLLQKKNSKKMFHNGKIIEKKRKMIMKWENKAERWR
jgi:hypothetical protein